MLQDFPNGWGVHETLGPCLVKVNAPYRRRAVPPARGRYRRGWSRRGLVSSGPPQRALPRAVRPRPPPPHQRPSSQRSLVMSDAQTPRLLSYWWVLLLLPLCLLAGWVLGQMPGPKPKEPPGGAAL